MASTGTARGLLPPRARLADHHDGLLVDLDGVVYTGPDPVPGAIDALTRARQRGLGVRYVTNNASRTPAEVADQLVGLGLPARPGDVVTSAEAAGVLLAARLPAAAPVLVVGSHALARAVRANGLRPVIGAAQHPRAVVQGYGPDVAWQDLAEAAFAIAQGAWWVATNCDPTLPTPRGLAPGNGALVAALAVATGRQPEVVGKPAPTLFRRAADDLAAARPLVVGDRLDTDIAGAVNAGFGSLLVLTGVSGPREVLTAPAGQRPDHVGADLRALTTSHPVPVATDTPDGATWVAASWQARVDGTVLRLQGGGDPAVGLGCAAAASWAAADQTGQVPDVAAAVATLDRLLPTHPSVGWGQQG